VVATQPRPEAAGEKMTVEEEAARIWAVEVAVACAHAPGVEEAAGAGQGSAGSRRPA
jgi:hypothetical protein